MNCCDQHTDTLPHGCRQGRDCPERTRRVQEAEAMGYEAANPALLSHPLQAVYLREPEPFDWQALVLWIAVVVCFAAVVALSIADPRDLSTLWPRLVAAVSL